MINEMWLVDNPKTFEVSETKKRHFCAVTAKNLFDFWSEKSGGN
ncbi:hypothetical protein C7447_101824 [Tenacibaculum adriaticum]|uniref:Uncharacterized protein n=1 Tax=Tenacibaculum adriaticum TaxID=413713 RepID=A0A5S5DWC5_9FLAO|nr:hypothetical protein C7447_101824 [Tenacibaculum adriaticum]